MKKPPFISHYLILKDLISGKDVRVYSDVIVYLTSRIENIKSELSKKEGLLFMEDILKESTYSYYKPYILIQSENNIKRAKEILKKYETKEVLIFLEHKRKVL